MEWGDSFRALCCIGAWHWGMGGRERGSEVCFGGRFVEIYPHKGPDAGLGITVVLFVSFLSFGINQSFLSYVQIALIRHFVRSMYF